jgi:uncharacterized FAD-dependent dehydrogenase
MHDVAVVGAGPGGLAAAVASRRLGANVVILEQGKHLGKRSQSDQTDIICGVGGAGLHSDGKFSFFPSATALWSIQPIKLLMIAYKWLQEILASSGMTVPNFPAPSTVSTVLSTNRLIRKNYPSFYLPIEERNAIVRELAAELAECLRPDRRVATIEHRSDDCIWLRSQDGFILAKARRVVLALGRLGPLMLHRSLAPEELIFRRIELGIRIEQPAEQFVLARDQCLDPKLMMDRATGCSWRTFCCCRNGLVIVSSSEGLTSVSGRADCPPSGRSNIGLLVRFTDARAGMSAWKEALRLQPLDGPVVEAMSELMDPSGQLRASSQVARTLGVSTARHVAEGLNDLRVSIGLPMADVNLHAPAIEGVGWYPRVGSDLRIAGRPIFVAGDATGMFRGLTAALVSGYVAGSAAAAAAIGTRSRRHT